MNEHRRVYEQAREAAGGPGNGFICPECDTHRTTGETWRVHRWLAHGIKNAFAKA